MHSYIRNIDMEKNLYCATYTHNIYIYILHGIFSWLIKYKTDARRSLPGNMRHDVDQKGLICGAADGR